MISVGNLTAGGTGKTPLVELLVERFLAEGKKPVVVSRGYGRRSRGVLVVCRGRGPEVDVSTGGDEPVEIAHRFPTIGVVVGEKRVDAAMYAVKNLRHDMIVLDDGFQHRYLKRDLDIVVIDARRDLTREWFLPVGHRREPLSSLRRAGLLVMARVSDTTPLPWEANLRTFTRAPIIRCRYAIRSLHRFGTGERVDVEILKREPLVAFSGIGHPEGFRNDLLNQGMMVSGHRVFPDHHWYREKDLQSLSLFAAENHAAGFITTEKDAVRLEGMAMAREVFSLRPTYFTRLGVEILEGEQVFGDLIARSVQRDSTA